MTAALTTGTYWVDAPCPRCGQVEPVAVGLSSVLTVPEDGVPSIRVKAASKAVDHACGQLRLRLSEQPELGAAE